MLTDEQKSKLNELAGTGKTNAEIAAELNMGVKTVSNSYNGVNIRRKRADPAAAVPAKKAASLLIQEAAAEDEAPAAETRDAAPTAEAAAKSPSGPAPVTEQERIIALGVIREALETVKALYGLK